MERANLTPITRVDDHAAVLPVDMQDGLVPSLPAEVAEHIIANINEIVSAVRERGGFAVWANAGALPYGRCAGEMPPRGQMPPEFSVTDSRLEQRDEDLSSVKIATSAFSDPNLAQ
ncbi:hypothetical protein [Corynebacterium epidermidicanis]|uniref:Isochorismatase family protein n=1 Tax=Corynebacterium epidermidicanis TaxID=1050174 RepID=A0A0G3GVM7_9CORY|nr:hypothetical protein [Corynebacterium epidermidicanis]AKK03598.1 hypothetical protein CEPID_08745 [Corynebacterium epidermidicanis]